jgi:4-amino-4-deoxy-L-arabinose transferase-like glycosyltransferase
MNQIENQIQEQEQAAAVQDDERSHSPLDKGNELARFFLGFHHIDAKEGFCLALVMSVAAGLFLPFLGSTGFFDPWESHYGEVARQMAARDDFLYPYWKNSYFFSKPILLFWLTGPLYLLIGAGDAKGEIPELAELCGRLPITLISIFTVLMVYLAARRLWSRRAAVLSAIVLCTIPFYYFISRQAITDMLYVGPMSSAICLLAVAFFDDETRDKLKDAKIPWFMMAIFGLALYPQLWEIARSGAFLNRADILGSEFNTRIGFGAFLFALATTGFAILRRYGRDPLIHAAAFLVAIATLGKGPHAVALTGLVYFLYLLVTNEWHRLKRPALITGTLLFLVVAMPWYLTMFFFEAKDEGRKTWYTRFIIYDLFGRLGGGVHGNRGTHEYYVRYLAFGTLPWSPLIPVAVFSAIQKRLTQVKERTPASRFTLLCAIWFISYFAFFTFTTTKFHHYIFPLVIPSALLIGRWLDELLDSRHRMPVGIGILSVLTIAVIGRDLVAEPWQWVDLFSYHYVSYKPSYYFSKDEFWRISLGVATGVASLSLILGMVSDAAASKRSRLLQENKTVHWLLPLLAWPAEVGRSALSAWRPTANAGLVGCFLAGALAFSIYGIHVYQSNMSADWSHRALLRTYYSMREPGEPLLSYQMDWKGETFYSHNTDTQIKKSASRLKKEVEKPGREFVLVQQDRFKRIEQAIGASYKNKIKVVDRSNTKWFLVLIEE